LLLLLNDNTAKRAMKAKSYDNVLDYCQRTGIRKVALAARLGISRFKLAGLLYPERYPVALTDDIVAALADLLNRPASYVRSFYRSSEQRKASGF
jgi:hypothetical protein